MKQLFCDGLRQFGLTFTDPQGAYYVLLDVSKYGVKDDLHFCVVANSAYSQKPNAPNSAVTIHLYHTVLELVRRIEKNDFEGRTLTLKVKFLDFQQITRSITVDHILRTKDEILPLAKQLMQSVEFHSHPIRLLGLGVSNQKNVTAQEQQPWVELELEFEPWPEV